MADDARLSVGVFARRSRLSRKALRIYERLGLLRPAEVDPRTGYRWYTESQLTTARLVVLLRRLDMPLAEVGEVVSAPPPRAAELVDAYWARVERRVASQRELAVHLRHTMSGGDGLPGNYDVRERDVDSQWVLADRRHVRAPRLPAWIETTMTRLLDLADQHGGTAGPAFVVYHGEVTEDSDGPAECCVPIDPAATGAPARVEPAHREAYVRLTKAQVEYPQILSAYDAVSQWLDRNGHTAWLGPREIYSPGFPSAGPADEVCDVAFPMR
jgi:DNA-binding transcriptional MerR regulator